MKVDLNKIEILIAPIIEAMGYRIWHIELSKVKRKTLLRVYIDVSAEDERKSISIDDCSHISNQIGALLEVENLILGSYVLEVSSPGLNRSLYKLEHYQKYIGSSIRIVLRQPINKQHDFIGKIQEVFDDTLKLTIDDKIITFSLTNIRKANLVTDL